MKIDELATAAQLVADLAALDTVLRGLTGDEPWRGHVTISFGSYRCTIYDNHATLVGLLRAQRRWLVERLLSLGVEVE